MKENKFMEKVSTIFSKVKNPAYYNPVRRPERTQNRRNVVLGQMLKEDMITQQQYDSLAQIPIKLNFHRVDHKEGLAPYFREELRRFLLQVHSCIPHVPMQYLQPAYRLRKR